MIFKTGMFKLFVLLALFLGSSCHIPTEKTDTAIFVPIYVNDKIPDGYDTYTILLWSDYSEGYYTDKQWEMIRKAFAKLGESVGKKNAIIWMYDSNMNSVSISKSQDIIDKVNRGRIIADKLFGDIKYSETPTILFTNYNPISKESLFSYSTAISFNKAKPEIIIDFLNELAQLIRNEKIGWAKFEGRKILEEIHRLAKECKIKIGLKYKLIDIAIEKPAGIG